MAANDLILSNVKDWVRKVGEIQKQNLGRENLYFETKSTAHDLVTEVDELSERYILQAIAEKYPNHSIMAEESGDSGKLESEYKWVIDPLDGTTNYAHGLPIFSISIALQFRGETVLGVVYVPMLDLLFEAIRGEKAFVNGKRLEVGKKNRLSQCLLATGFPYDKAHNKDNNIDYFSRITPQARGIRRLGSAAYDLANVAAGIYDGYWELNLKPWDVAAGILLVEEAGGKVIRLNQKRGVSIIAGNHAVAEILYKEISK